MIFIRTLFDLILTLTLQAELVPQRQSKLKMMVFSTDATKMICATDTTRTATEAGDAFNGATDPAACSAPSLYLCN